MTDAERRAEFTSFVQTYWSQLMTIAVAVSGSRHDAEDLVQTALTNTYGRWPKIREGEALAYLRRSIANAHISRWRRHRGAELTVAETPDSAATDHGPRAVDDRLLLVPLLRNLPHGQRAVLVLRYLCDLSDHDVAATLGTSTGTVRSQAARGLATLRRRHARGQPRPDDDPAPELVLSHPEGTP
jgi:RNA polymerase sigma-70 factor (sigma-E family)